VVVSEGVMIALIAATPPAIAAILGYFANRHSLRRSVGAPPGVPLARVVERVEGNVDRLDTKIDRLAETQTGIRERLARVEGSRYRRSAWDRSAWDD
jgi:hypothetical protein